jgi:hypothetical protein
MFKDIISNQEGQNLFPGIPTYIKGAPGVTPITMKNTKPQIALTKYGATQMMPGMEYAFPGNGVLEIPTAQMGGSQQDQIMQLIMAYAKKKQQDPKQLIAQIQQLPKDQQAKAIQAIMQDVQQDQGMQMAKDGGCIDCQEAYPQAQNLNWFYKAQGGTAFPAANMYPESWVGYNGTAYKFGGEEAYPQAQTYLPYDRPGETRPNFMFEFGGQSIDDIYQKMKAGGLNFDPKKKRGGELSKETFAQYIQRNGGNLPKAQMGPPTQLEDLSQRVSPIYAPEREDYGMPTDEVMNQQSAFDPWEDATGRAGRMDRRYQRQQDRLAASATNPTPQKRRSNPFQYGFTLPDTLAVMGQSSKSPLVKRIGAAANIFSVFDKLAGNPTGINQPVIMAIGGDPWWSSSDSPMFQDIQKKAQEEASKQVPIATFNQTTTGSDDIGGMPSANAKAIELDPNKNAINQKTPKKVKGDIEGSARMVGALGAAGSLLEEANRIEEMEKLKGRVNTTDMAYQTVKEMDFGDYAQRTQGSNFRPNQMQYAQKEAGYTEQSPLFYGKMGGDIMNMLQDGAEIDLDMYDEDTQNKIVQAIYAMGGSIEYI